MKLEDLTKQLVAGVEAIINQWITDNIEIKEEDGITLFRPLWLKPENEQP